MRILFATGSAAGYMAPPRLGEEQINCGPDWLDHDVGGHYRSLNTPLGVYDLAAVVGRLPGDQQPDAVVCLVDASWRSVPRNLRALDCPKVLLVADTHHLTHPISGMVQYAQSEPYDRVVLLYDRHHLEFFRAAGMRNLHWFPGLTFPHGDGQVHAARSTGARASQIAFVGQIGICHPRRIRMLEQLNAGQLPVVVKPLSQTEALPFYGHASIGFNASLNGDLNLRIFEILASGAMLLTDKLAPAAGLADLLRPGVEYVSYDSPEELIERARHAVAHPEEAAAIGAAGARWFDAVFSEAARREAFQRLVLEGTSRPEFALPSTSTVLLGSQLPALRARLIAGYEYVQELHRNLDRIVVALDETVPAAFAELCATLPRIEVRHGLPARGTRVDFLAVGRKHYGSPLLAAALQVWSWEDPAAERVALARRCSSMGFSLVDAENVIFSRQRVNTHGNDGAVALVRMEQGGYEDAFNLARKELDRNPKSVDALFVALELAQEKGNAELVRTMLARLRVLAPHHPRLKDVECADAATIRQRRPQRLLRAARGRFEQQKWDECVQFAREAQNIDPESAEAHFLLGRVAMQAGQPEQSVAMLSRASRLAPERADYWFAHGRALSRAGRTLDAMSAWLHTCALEPENFEYAFALGEAALAAGHARIAVEAFAVAVRLEPGHAAAARCLARARERRAEQPTQPPRDLLLSHVEVTRLQGTGVLLERFFPQAGEFVTVRSRTLYGGAVHFGGDHFSIDLPGLDEAGRRGVLQRILAGYTIRRILCVPFFATDFQHALLARELTGAPLCTYVMDDQVLHARDVPAELATRLFAASDLRLAISPEMITEYSAWFRCSFGLLPPVVTVRADEYPNRWDDPDGPARHGALVGNIWSARQFEQVRAFTRAAGLRLEWYGNSRVPWLPQDRGVLEADGIFCRGFLPEPELARRLAEHPFVVVPSGTLDGTEDNEWLTRLSLPSRMVFIVTRTQTPILVLGSEHTAAARFVAQFGLGVSSNYDPAEASRMLEALTRPEARARWIENARRVASAFLLPDAGEWIWRSLAAKRAEPAPFDELYAANGTNESGQGGVAAAPSLLARSATAEALPRADAADERELGDAGVRLPQTLNLQPIDVCNSRCVMCRVWADGKPEKLSLKQLEELLRRPFFREVTHVGVTGGEPTLRKDLLEIFRMLPRSLPKLRGASFITHGLQTERTVEIFSRVHDEYRTRGYTFEGMISLDGVGEVHDRVRGRAGAFAAASRTLLQLKARGVPVMAACTIVRSNVYGLHDLLDWGRTNGVYVRFRIGEFIRRLYNHVDAAEIRSFTARELRHLVCFLHLLVTEYERDEVILRTYRSDLSILTGGARLTDCPYRRGAAVNVGSMGELAGCAPKGAPFAMPARDSAVHASLAAQRVELSERHCPGCIHDYHDEWSPSTAVEIERAKQAERELYGAPDESLTTAELPAEGFSVRGMQRILLVGWYGTETAGDIAILRGIVAEYLELNPELRCDLLSLYPDYTRTTLANWPAALAERIRVLDYSSGQTVEAVTRCDAVVMAGGPLMDIPETRKILCLFKRFAELGKPRVIEGCGIGPLNDSALRWNVCRIARLATRIAVRDRASREYLRLLAIRKDIVLRHDPAVRYLRSLGIRHHGAGSRIIRCFLRELTSEYPQSTTPEQATEHLAGLLRRLLEWYPEHKVELWAMHHFPVGKDDRLHARQLEARVGSPRLRCDWEPRTPEEIVAAMAEAEFCLCMRFHSCVFAAEVGVPFLAIDYTNGGKIQGLLEESGQTGRLTTLAGLREIDHAQLAAKLAGAGGARSRGDRSPAGPRVLHLVQQLTGGGGARAAVALAKYSQIQDGAPHCVVSLAPADAAGLALAEEAALEVVNCPEWSGLRGAMAAADLVLVHWWNHPDFARLFRREWPPVRLALWLHVGGFHAPQVITRALFSFADLVVACSPHTYDHPAFREAEGFSAGRTAMVMAGADFSRVTGVTPRAHAGYRVGYIGTVDRVKMHRDFVAMSSRVRTPDVRFVVCGAGETRWLEEDAIRLGARERFDFRGPVEDIRGEIEQFDVYGYPLCPETYAAAELNLQEVMYAGVPVVAFPHGGIGRLIRHGETGLLVNTPEEYVEALERLHREPGERRRLGANAAAEARRHWGAENAARAFRAHWDRLLCQPKRQRTWISAAGPEVDHDPGRGFATSPGARMFLDSLGEAAAPFVATISSEGMQDRLRAFATIAESSHLLRYNGVETYRSAWPREPLLHAWAGLMMAATGDVAGAREALAQARQHGHGDWRLSWYLAQRYAASGWLAPAALELHQVLSANPAFAPAQGLLRRFAGLRAGGDESRWVAEPAGGLPAVLGEASRLLKQGQPSRAREHLQRAVGRWLGNLDLLELVAELDCRLNQLESARGLFAAIVAQNPQRSTPRLQAIEHALRAGTQAAVPVAA